MTRTSQGYSVEGTIPRTAMEKMGFRLEAVPNGGWDSSAADFSSDNGQAEPKWITWVDAKGSKPDFHVAESFGTCTLGPEKE